jgi:hypothetical protein
MNDRTIFVTSIDAFSEGDEVVDCRNAQGETIRVANRHGFYGRVPTDILAAWDPIASEWVAVMVSVVDVDFTVA